MICDFAEYYGLYDWRSVPVRTAAALCAGLRPNSRTKMKLSGIDIPYETYLLVALLDQVNIIRWLQTEDARKGTNRPPQLLRMFTNNETEYESYRTGEEFEKARIKLLGGLNV